MHTKKFPDEVVKVLEWYVYLYFDPREAPHNRRPFYVGKGEGNRAFGHLAATDECEKVERIAAIREAGKEPKIEILRYGLTEDQAFLLEAAVIDCIGLDHLTNEVRGKHTSFGRVAVKDVLLMMSAPKAKIDDPCILININQMYSSEMTSIELMEATRGVWKVGRRREDAILAMAIFRGVIVEVYEINKTKGSNKGWFRGGTLTYKTRHANEVKASDRWEFDGDVAPEHLRKKYVGRSVRHLMKQGSQNPIHYVNC